MKTLLGLKHKAILKRFSVCQTVLCITLLYNKFIPVCQSCDSSQPEEPGGDFNPHAGLVDGGPKSEYCFYFISLVYVGI